MAFGVADGGLQGQAKRSRVGIVVSGGSVDGKVGGVRRNGGDPGYLEEAAGGSRQMFCSRYDHQMTPQTSVARVRALPW